MKSDPLKIYACTFNLMFENTQSEYLTMLSDFWCDNKHRFRVIHNIYNENKRSL